MVPSKYWKLSVKSDRKSDLYFFLRLEKGMVTCDNSTQYRDFDTEIREAIGNYSAGISQ